MSKKDLKSLSVKELGELFPVQLSDFSPGWKKLFQFEKDKILNLFDKGELKGKEHIGSTAIPGMKAKPTIDILLEIEKSTGTNRIISMLERIGYEYISKPENPPPHMMFAKGYSSEGYSGQTFHIHVRYPGQQDEILFRDYLINNLEARTEYQNLKLSLAAQTPDNRELYTLGKTSFVKSIVRMAKEEDYQGRHI